MDCLLRRRAVERAARQPEHRLHRLHHRRTVVQPPRKGPRHARRLGRRQPEGHAGHPDGGDGSAAVVREDMENKQEMAEIIGRRQWFNVPVADIIGRIKGDINYGAAASEGHRTCMKFWGEKGNLLSLEEPRHLVHHREHPLGQVRAGTRHQGAGRQDQPLGSLARGRQRRSASPDLPSATAAASRPSSTARSSIRPTPGLSRIARPSSLHGLTPARRNADEGSRSPDPTRESAMPLPAQRPKRQLRLPLTAGAARRPCRPARRRALARWPAPGSSSSPSCRR
jgi:hypothetical protein